MKREIILVDNVEAVDSADNATAFNEAAAEVSTPDARFTADDIAKARQQEKSKVYKTVENLQEKLARLEKEAEERAAAEAERSAKRQAREAERLAEKKKQEEDEMSFKALLQTKEKEWQSQLEAERKERETAFALLEREKQYNDLVNYRAERLAAERENIIPSLIDLISGDTKDAIEQSISTLKTKSAQILEEAAAAFNGASQNSRKAMVGASITSPANGPLDNNMDPNSFSPKDISQMSMKEYAEKRSGLLSNPNNRGQGLFG